MDTPNRNNYAALRAEHARAVDEFYRTVADDVTRRAEQSGLEREANRDPEIRAPEPAIEGGYHKNYGILRDEHERQREELYCDLEATQNPAAELEEPARPTGPVRSPGWTNRGDMAHQQSSAADWVKASWQRRAALREQTPDQDPNISPDQIPKRDDDIQR